MSVTDRDRGARALVRRMTDRRFAPGPGEGAHVDVGVVGDRAAEAYEGDEGVTVAQVAEWAELGLGQPMRSWLRGWVDENGPAIEARIRTEVRAYAIDGRGDQRKALERIGAWMVGEIRKRIAAGIDPPNAQSTIDKKGSSKPLIDSGQFRSALTSRVGNGA